MFDLYEFEIGKAAGLLCKSLAIKPKETVVITSDTESDSRVVMATARAVTEIGAIPLVIVLASPLGVSKAADAMLPVDALSACLEKTDVWIEFNNQWLLYSTPFERATATNIKLRYMCLVGMNVDMLIKMIGRVNQKQLGLFLQAVFNMTRKARYMRITTPAGTDVSFENTPDNPMYCDSGIADIPGVHFLSGQIGWAPKLVTINGTIVFDGSISPPLGKLTHPVTLEIVKGSVKKIKGGWEAEQYKEWLKSFDDGNMFRLAHVCYGFNPGARLTGNVLEDERVWGCTEWGLGYQSAVDVPPDGIMAKSHTDGICLNSSVWLDDIQLLDRGKAVHKDLIELASAILVMAS